MQSDLGSGKMILDPHSAAVPVPIDHDLYCYFAELGIVKKFKYSQAISLSD
jgi:hypothetical protein